VLYYMLTGQHAFDHEMQQDIENAIKNGNFGITPQFQSISSSAKDLISKSMTVDVEKRITVKQALVHPWLCDCKC
jgi:serine/threonine protein kinase